MSIDAIRQSSAAAVFLAVAAALAALALYDVASIPTSSYEPLGTAAFPRAIAVIVLALVALKAAALLGAPPDHDRETDEQWYRPYLGSGGMFVLSVLYLVVLAETDVDFRIVTSVFLFVATWAMAVRLSVRALFLVFVSAVAGSILLDLLFKHFLYVDL